MAATAKKVRFETMADVLEQLGGIPARRVRLHPVPGKATEHDLIAIQDKTNRNYELVDGVLVEKPVGHLESSLAIDLSFHIRSFLANNDLGYLTGESGPTRLLPGLVRMPDVGFLSWEQLPKRERLTEPIANIAPALAVEVLSEGNTKKEMRRKLREYFFAGVRLVWIVNPKRRTVEVHTSPDCSVLHTENQILDGGDILPGFKLSLHTIFAGVPLQFGKTTGKKASRRPSARKKRGGKTA